MSGSHDDEILHRTLDTDQEEPAGEIAAIVADLEDTDIESLTPLYRQVDHVVDHVFADPPVDEAQVEITFSYEGYRISVEQNGNAQFIKIQ